jgi:organic radical activating enzyme
MPTQEEEYDSCAWVEGGIAFNRRSLHTCLIVHHNTGLPFITDFQGEEFPLEKVLAVRNQIRAANRRREGHPECKGCPHLTRQRWPKLKHEIEIVGIAHYSFCNIKCNYCFLQTQDPASFAAGYQPYSLLPIIRTLIENGTLSPNAIIDWGGGEPTHYKEFDELLEILLAHGTFHYVHTNGTRMPAPVRRTTAPERIHVICSIDAGLPETYVKIKKRDYLERVWTNLEEYVQRGVKVTLKYIVKAENCTDIELRAFIERAARIRAPELIVDIDYDYPQPGEEIIVALARLKQMALRAGMHARYGFTGANFAPENNVAIRVEAAFQAEQLKQIAALVVSRNFAVGESVDLAVENLVRSLEKDRAGLQKVCARNDELFRALKQPYRLVSRLIGSLFGMLARRKVEG